MAMKLVIHHRVSILAGLHPDIDSNRHGEAYQISFLKEYLETRRILEHVDGDVTDDDVSKLYVMTSKTILVRIIVIFALFRIDDWKTTRRRLS
jgi:hypothetical protein